MDPQDLSEIHSLVWSGLFDRARVLQIMDEEYFGPGQCDPVILATAIEDAFSRYESEQATYPAVTDCDRLDEALAALNRRGIIAIANAGMTQSDGHDDFRNALARAPDRTALLGYCFYHGQDRDRAIAGGGLYLAFGPREARDEPTKGPEVGRIVRDELERVGFAVEWDGTFERRISIPRFNWQRRPSYR